MCLYTINRAFNPPKPGAQTAYKVLRGSAQNSYAFPYYPDKGPAMRRVWLTAHKEEISAPGQNWFQRVLLRRKSYISGFHCFPDAVSASEFQKNIGGEVVEVQIDNILAIGTQSVDNKLLPCIVAEKLFIP